MNQTVPPTHPPAHTDTQTQRRQKRKVAETQELLLCAAVSSSCFCRFFALISFMASSMERVSLLLATGTGRGKKNKKRGVSKEETVREAKQYSISETDHCPITTHRSHRPCWPRVYVLHLLQLMCRSGDCTCLCSWSWDRPLASLFDWMLLLPMPLVPAVKR